jgi:uncharacterized protein (DUF4415 family)
MDVEFVRTKFDPATHDDNPPLSDALMARMKPSKRGRPRAENPKEQVTLRLDPDILARFRATGDGWQTRINEALRRVAP